MIWSLLFLQALQLLEGGMLFNFYNGLALIKYVILMQGSRSGFLEPGFFGFFGFFSFGRTLDSQNQGKKLVYVPQK